MAVVALDHVQLAMPEGGEDRARAFFVGLLGFEEMDKPERLRTGGGLWLRSGAANVHFGVEIPFRPARKAHPCLAVADLDRLAARLSAGNMPVEWDDRIPGTRRFFSADPFGNRIEFIQAAGERPR